MAILQENQRDSQSSEMLGRRRRAARRQLRRCRLCEWRCDVNRLRNERGRCRLTAATHIYKRYLSYNEEPELAPAYRLFLSACSFRCTFCDEAPHAFDPHDGELLDPASLAAECEDAIRTGARCISILGGEPTIHAHYLLELAAAAESPLPIAINTNLYMTPDVIELLRGVVHYYLADFKFGNDDCALRIGGIPDYTRIVRRNLHHAAQAANIIVRHVLLPGHLDCCFRPLIDWLAREMPTARLQLYPGYVPLGSAACDPQLGRLNTRGDVDRAIDIFRHTNLDWRTPVLDHQALPLQPSLGAGVASLTIGRDGRIYCHDASASLLPVLAALQGGDGASNDRAPTTPLPILDVRELA